DTAHRRPAIKTRCGSLHDLDAFDMLRGNTGELDVSTVGAVERNAVQHHKSSLLVGQPTYLNCIERAFEKVVLMSKDAGGHVQNPVEPTGVAPFDALGADDGDTSRSVGEQPLRAAGR